MLEGGSHRSFVLDAITTASHLSARKLQALLADRGAQVSHHAVWQFLRREGLSFRKTLFLCGVRLEIKEADIARS